MAAPRATIVVDRDVECPMRDGTVLRADVYRPPDGQHPVLVHRTPYSKQHPMGVTNLMVQPMAAVDRGYVVVVQDTRGRFSSDGTWTPLHDESDDGADTIEWAAEEPWSDGRVGIYGSSYMGVTTLQAVAAAPPHLVAAAAYLTGGDYHDGWVYTSGALELLFNLRWAAGQSLTTADRVLDGDALDAAVARLRAINEDPAAAMAHTPLIDVFGPADAAVPYWRTWLEHPDADDFWAAVDLPKRLADTEVPVLNIAGWYDQFLHGQLAVVAALADSPRGRRGHHRTVIGPWDHESYQGMRPNAAGDEFFGLDAMSGSAGVQGRVLDWFDHWFADTEADPAGPPVRYFRMGAVKQWHQADAWPPTSDVGRLWLTSGGRANTRRGDGQLALVEPQADQVDAFVYDPHNPVPTTGGRHLGYWYGRAGVQDQAGVEDRDDVLVYTSPLLTHALEVTGHVHVRLYLRTSALATDLTAKLVDVRPDGYCANVAEGIRRLDTAPSGETPEPVDIDLWDTAYRFGVGHRVRLEVSSSNFPRFDRHGNIPGLPAASHAEDWQTAIQQIHSGPATPSCLVLGGMRTLDDPDGHTTA